jgi:molybdate transport system substrate-binding protein
MWIKIFLGLVFSYACIAKAGNVMVAVASNFTLPMQKISQAFEQETGHKLILSFGSTGSFYAQIQNAAPYQLLLSADSVSTDQLEKTGYAQKNSSFTYAVGRLVLWSNKSNFIDGSADILRSNQFKKIAIANPKLAPYGLAAIETLKNLNLESQLNSKIIQGENISQTHQFILTENAELGFVALSQVFQDGKISNGSAWIVPSNLYSPIIQKAVILNLGKGQDATLKLVDFLKSDKAKAIIKSFGYETP